MGCSSSSAPGKGSPTKGSPTKGASQEDSAPRVAHRRANRAYWETIQLISKVPLLHDLPRDLHPLLASAGVRLDFQKDEVILKLTKAKGQRLVVSLDDNEVVDKAMKLASPSSASSTPAPVPQVFLITGGQASICYSINDQDLIGTLASLQAGDFFSLKSLDLRGDFKSALEVSIITESSVSVLMWTADKLQELGIDESFLMDPTGSVPSRAARRQNSERGYYDGARVKLTDMQRVGLLGAGGYGAVELSMHKHSGQTYALKGYSKGRVLKEGMKERVTFEKAVLRMTNSPFIIEMYGTYNQGNMLFFLLEPAMGGELFATYRRKGFFGKERHALFYIASCVFALEHFHERGIVYRDLKPENLVFDERGHLKVTDMGLAKFVADKTYTACGTPDYLSPEMISGLGHGQAQDWWSLGILLYELLAGKPPFSAEFPKATYQKVLKGIDRVQFPKECQGDAKVLVSGLLRPDPDDRLTMRPGGTQNLRGAQWYKGFDWDAMSRQELEPPYVPKVTSKTDTSNFYAKLEDMPKNLKYSEDGSEWDKDFEDAEGQPAKDNGVIARIKQTWEVQIADRLRQVNAATDIDVYLAIEGEAQSPRSQSHASANLKGFKMESVWSESGTSSVADQATPQSTPHTPPKGEPRAEKRLATAFSGNSDWSDANAARLSFNSGTSLLSGTPPASCLQANQASTRPC